MFPYQSIIYESENLKANLHLSKMCGGWAQELQKFLSKSCRCQITAFAPFQRLIKPQGWKERTLKFTSKGPSSHLSPTTAPPSANTHTPGDWIFSAIAQAMRVPPLFNSTCGWQETHLPFFQCFICYVNTKELALFPRLCY